MNSKELVKRWFSQWEAGNFLDLPITDSFTHISPYGSIETKATYIQLVEDNKDKFLGHTFEFHDELFGPHSACVRYTARKDDFSLDVSEWYYFKDDLIHKIVAYYNIEGEISEERKLKNLT